MSQFRTSTRRTGFTLVETIIAIGIVAALLTTFFAVFSLATQTIRRAISAEEADRLAYALEEELVTLRGDEAGEFPTAFNKAFQWISGAAPGGSALLVYQYRGDPRNLRADGTLAPFTGSDGVAGQDFLVQSTARHGDNLQILAEDFEALEGGVYVAVLTQLVFENGELVRGTPGTVVDPHGNANVTGPDDYPEAVIAFAADFHALPSSTVEYVRDLLDLGEMDRPVFSRNLAVRR